MAIINMGEIAMLERWSTDLAQFFYANSGVEYDDGDIEVYSYGLQLLLSSVFEISAVLILGLCIGRLFETVAFFSGFIPLRLYAGGYHAKTHFRCFMVLLATYLIFLTVLYITPIEMANHTAIVLVCVSAFSILKLAPIADANKPIGPIQHKEYRRKSVSIYFFQAIIIAGISIAGVFPYIALSLAVGQLTVAGSLAAAKLINVAGHK